MTYTIKPEQRCAKAYGRNIRASTKALIRICKFIRGKKLNVVKRLLNDLLNEKRSIDGKYYTKSADELSRLLHSCEKNAVHMGLDVGRLFVHASAHKGAIFRRRRRKSKFGSRMKNTNLEVVLIERTK
jgi:ribosomal protein L22